MDIAFYHLTNSTIEVALPKLLDKMLKAKRRVLLIASNEEMMQKLDIILWTFSTKIFLPHGTTLDPYINEQNILIHINSENLNNANTLLDLRVERPENNNFEKIIHLFSGLNEEELNKARILYKNYKEEGHNLTYFKQKPTGEWEKT